MGKHPIICHSLTTPMSRYLFSPNWKIVYKKLISQYNSRRDCKRTKYQRIWRAIRFKFHGKVVLCKNKLFNKIKVSLSAGISKNPLSRRTGTAEPPAVFRQFNRFLVLQYPRQGVVPSGGCSLVARLVCSGFC